MIKKQYKYKREHFNTQQEYERFKARMNKAQKRWLEKSESANPEKRKLLINKDLTFAYFLPQFIQ